MRMLIGLLLFASCASGPVKGGAEVVAAAPSTELVPFAGLVLDVNPNRGKTWAWVPATKLFAAMRTYDKVENRGYLLVREGHGRPFGPSAEGR